MLLNTFGLLVRSIDRPNARRLLQLVLSILVSFCTCVALEPILIAAARLSGSLLTLANLI